jgi:hypothetical protein
MSMDAPEQNKMMVAPPAKKQYHFPGGGYWANMTLWAETIEEATELYHRTKQLINPSAAEAVPSAESRQNTAAEQSTASPQQVPEENAVQ